VELAITSSYALLIRNPPTKEQCANIRKALLAPKWKTLRDKLEKKHRVKVEHKPPMAAGSLKKGKLKLLEGNLNAMVLNPNLITGALGIGIFATLDFSRHPLLESTLLDNYSVTHVINSVSLLNKGMFIKERPRVTVKAGMSSLLIISYSTCIIKGILNRRNKKVNLVLLDMAVIKGFLLNIISKALLRKKGA
jgi:hypothetical protein